MQKFNIFFRTFWKSISSFSYYHDIVKAKFSFSFKYFVLFNFLLGIFSTIAITMTISPPLNRFVSRFKNRARSLYPADLQIEIKQGELSTNVAEPFHVPIPFELFTEVPPAISDQKQQYLLTIDTQANIEDFSKSQSVILLTKDNLAVVDENNGFRVYPLKDAQNFSLNKKVVDQMLDKILPLVDYALPVLTLTILSFFILFWPVGKLVGLLWLSLLVLMISKLMKLSLSYRKIYQIGLHALTLPVLIQYLLTALKINPPVLFFNSLLYILYSLVILAELKKTPPKQIDAQVSRSQSADG